MDEEDPSARTGVLLGDATTASSNEGQVMFHIEAMKTEILCRMRAELSARFEAQQAGLSRIMEAICANTADKIVQQLSSYAPMYEGSKSSDHTKPKYAPLALPHFHEVTNARQETVPFLQWTTLATVVSFTQGMPAARGWVPEKAYQKNLSDCVDVIAGASGLSAILFSVKTNEAKAEKLDGAAGRLWSFILRNTMGTVLRNGMIHIFDSRNLENLSRTVGPSQQAVATEGSDIGSASFEHKKKRPPPAWLSSFGKKAITAAAVNKAVDRLEGKEDTGACAKKRKLYHGGVFKGEFDKSDGTEHADEVRFQVLKKMRSNFMVTMNHGRTEVRAHLFSELLFLVERVSKFSSIEEAKANGFEIVFEKGSPNEENLTNADELQGSIWDVPNTKTVHTAVSSAADMTSTYEANRAKMRQLQSRFPSLYVTLKYNKTVRRPAHDSAAYEEHLAWPVVEKVSLHRVATGVLMEIFKAGSHEVVLSASPYSLKAVHILAIGLRGLLRRCLNYDLSELEKCALGDVTHEDVPKGESTVTVKMDGRPRKDSKGPNRLEKVRLKKFSMSWEEYQKAKAAEEEEKRRQINIAVATVEGDDSDDDSDLFICTG